MTTQSRLAFEPDEHSDNYMTLLCPRCGQGYLHHAGIKVYSRGEDADTTLVASVDDGVIKAENLPSPFVRNPSSRRHGIAIRFWCECCGDEEEQQSGDMELTIAQHKGMTHLAWRY